MTEMELNLEDLSGVSQPDLEAVYAAVREEIDKRLYSGTVTAHRDLEAMTAEIARAKLVT